MPFFQDAEYPHIEDSTFVDVGGNLQITINNNNTRARYSLPYADGASWNGTRGCLPGTRVQLLEDIVHQITGTNAIGTPQVVLLAGVAGSGKTAIAHSIAQYCYEKGMLASSFFFDREISGRNGPEKLITTIALDLAGLSEDIAGDIDRAVEQERSLASTSLSRQFDELILKPFQRHPINRPMVVVIDALDESLSSDLSIELLKILRDHVPNLPANFRMFITSRPLWEIDAFLSTQHHVFRLMIHMDAQANLEDIAIYAKTKLKELALLNELGDNWPDEQLLNDFTRMAEGLFLWVSTVCKYICTTISPDSQLRSLVSRRDSKGPRRAEEKMYKLYREILESCNWEDEDFVEGYKLLMGTIIAAKSPLSIQALQTFHSITVPMGSSVQSYATVNTAHRTHHRSLPNLHTETKPRSSFQLWRIFRRFGFPSPIVRSRSDAYPRVATSHSNQALCATHSHNNLTVPAVAVLRPLGSLLTGLTNTEHPVRIPHLSFRDFVTVRAHSKRFYVNEKEHSQRLALLCLLVLNENLKEGIPGVGYLAEDESANPGIPEIAECQISEEVWYACRFWPDHVINVESPMSMEFRAALWDLLSTKIVRWIEIVTARGKFRNLRGVQEWLQRTVPNEDALINTTSSSDLASSLFKLSNRLSYMDRREEASDAIEQAVEVQQKLATKNSVFNSDLANSLSRLSVCLSKIGHRDTALDKQQEAVKIWRNLAMDQPKKFNPYLAGSLNSLANRLSALGRRNEALYAIQQAVDIRRKLAVEHPAEFEPSLALSLHTLSNNLSYYKNRKNEALDVIRQAVCIQRTLAARDAVVYNPNLARSLVVLSMRLSDKGGHDEALTIIQEAVEILRQLAVAHPAEFDPDFARSLHTLSNRLFHVGRRDSALDAIQQAVVIWMKLVTKRPEVFNPNLTESLCSLSRCLSYMDRQEEALDEIQKAVEIQRGLATQYPLAFKPGLTRSLKQLSQVLSKLGKEEEARVASQEADTLALHELL